MGDRPTRTDQQAHHTRLFGLLAVAGLVALTIGVLVAALRDDPPARGNSQAVDGATVTLPASAASSPTRPTPTSQVAVLPLCTDNPRLQLQDDGHNLLVWYLAGATDDCGLGGLPTVTIVGPDGTPLEIDANGSPIKQLSDYAGTVAFVGVEWANWCGMIGPYTFIVARDGAQAREEFDLAPDCIDPDRPSTLMMADAFPPGLAVMPPTPTPSATLNPALPACEIGDVALTIGGGGGLTGGAIGIGVTAERANRDCHLRGDVTVTLRDSASGDPLDILGNGSTYTFDADLLNSGTVGTAFGHLIWSNWCGITTDIILEASLNGQSATLTPLEHARCQSDSDPSYLHWIIPVTGPTPTT